MPSELLSVSSISCESAPFECPVDWSLLSVPDEVDGMPPLHLAVEYGHPEVVKLLLDAGADQDLLDAHGHSPDSPL